MSPDALKEPAEAVQDPTTVDQQKRFNKRADLIDEINPEILNVLSKHRDYIKKHPELWAILRGHEALREFYKFSTFLEVREHYIDLADCPIPASGKDLKEYFDIGKIIAELAARRGFDLVETFKFFGGKYETVAFYGMQTRETVHQKGFEVTGSYGLPPHLYYSALARGIYYSQRLRQHPEGDIIERTFPYNPKTESGKQIKQEAESFAAGLLYEMGRHHGETFSEEHDRMAKDFMSQDEDE